MNIIDRLIDYIHGRQRNGLETERLPVTREEEYEILSSMPASVTWKKKPAEENSILGIPVWRSPYAVENRGISINAPTYSEETEFGVDRLELEGPTEIRHNRALQVFKCRLLTDQTEIKIRVECDPWVKLKRRFKWIARRWPIRTKTVTVDGRVIYPFLKIQLPANRHVVKFTVRGE